MPWGTGAWGTGSWGLGGAGLSISYAAAIATHTIRVWLTQEPLNTAPTLSGDATNPATWTITRPGTSTVWTVWAATRVSAHVWDIRVQQPLESSFVTHRIASATLCDTAGTLVTAPYSADFPGAVLSDSPPLPSGNTRDLANSPHPYNPPGGTLEIAAGGDYRISEGDDLLRKLIARRLSSVPGEWFHMPEYGCGLRLLQPTAANDLPRLKAQILAQVRREPEIVDATVTLSLTAASGVLAVQIRARTQYGSTVESTLSYLPGGISL